MTTLTLPAGLLLLTVTACFLPVARAQCLPDQPDLGGMDIKFGISSVTYNGLFRLSSIGSHAPTVTATGVEGDLLLVMVDPDAPSARFCPTTYWLHWIAEIHILNNEIVIEKTLLTYNQPSPPPRTGAHRYQFILYTLNLLVPSNLVPSSRSGFDLARFISSLGLDNSNPVASFQFTTEH